MVQATGNFVAAPSDELNTLDEIVAFVDAGR
jgi:hypothetical protein